MTLRLVKSLFAFVVVLGAGLALAVTPAASAAALVLDWQVIGTGTGAPNGCAVTTGGATCIFSGNATGDHVGRSTYVINIIAGDTIPGLNGSGGECALSSGTGNVTAADGSKVNFNTVGLLCEEGALGTPIHYNGTYRICSPATTPGCPTSAGGRFSDAVGGGNLAATTTQPFSTPSPPVSFIKIDGTINF